MHSRLIKVMFAALLAGTSLPAISAEGADSGRDQKLENLMELAVDRFELNRYVEARAALNRLIAENPTDEEAFKLRKLFGEKILLNMQKYGDRPVLSDVERQVLTLLSEASFAIDMRNAEKAGDRLQKVVDAYKKGGFGDDSYEIKRAQALLGDVKDGDLQNGDEFDAISKSVDAWKEELQSVGNAPLLLLSRAQRFEQSQLRAPAMITKIVGDAVKSPKGAQRYMLEIDRLGVYAVPQLVTHLRNDKNDIARTNAHYILLALGDVATMPLCQVLSSNDQLLLQQVCNILGDMKPTDMRSLPYLKAVYDNTENLASTRNAAAIALESVTGKKVGDLLGAADYFLSDANHYYLGGAEVDEEMMAQNNTLWVWDAEANGGKGALQQVEVPAFIISDVLAEDMVYKGMKLAQNKVPFQVLLASLFMQQKYKVDLVNKLLKREDMSLPNMDKMRKDAVDWAARLYRNMRVAYTLGPDYLAAVLEKAEVDNKPEVAIAALDGICTITGKDGWKVLNKYNSIESEATAPVGTAAKPAKEGVGSSGDGEVIAEVDEVAVTAPASAPVLSGKTALNPVLAALKSSNERVAVAAANCLIRIGLPESNSSYSSLKSILVKGAQENRATVSLVISGSHKLRDRMANMLEKDHVVALTAGDGYAGYALAVQYPPKDAIFIDNRIDQFDSLRFQLEMRNVSHGKILPLTIITTRDHALNIANQFTPDAVKKEATKSNQDEENMINSKNDSYESKPWKVIVRHDVPADSAAVYGDLETIGKNVGDSQPVVILTNPTREGRYKIKESLMLAAERSLRSSGLTEYSRIRGQERVLGDIFGVRATYVPVFVDEELGGFDAMKTVQALLTDPRTRPVPIAILTDANRVANVKKDYELFINDGKVQVINRDIDSRKLIDIVNEMKSKNILSKNNFARAMSNDIATDSAEALDMLNVAAAGNGLSDEQQKELLGIVEDTTRPMELRIAVASALGHFKASEVLEGLVKLFGDTDAKNVALRAAILRSIGKIDTANTKVEFKLKAMEDPSEIIQKEAARALGPAAQGTLEISEYLTVLRPNDLVKLAHGDKPVGVAEAAASTEEAATTEAATETKDESATTEEATETKEDATEKKDESDPFSW